MAEEHNIAHAPDALLAHYQRQATIVATRLLEAGEQAYSREAWRNGYHLHQHAVLDGNRMRDTGRVYVTHLRLESAWDELNVYERMFAVTRLLAYQYPLRGGAANFLRVEYHHGDEQEPPYFVVGEAYTLVPTG